MNTQGATALFERLSSDEEFRSKLEAAPTREEKRRVVTEAGYDVSRDDLPTIRNLAGISELSDADLEQVAAGGATATIVGGSIGGALGIAGIVGVVAAFAL